VNGSKKSGMRYKFFALVLVIFALTSFDLTEAQQPKKLPRIGVLRADSPPNPSVETFQQAMRDLGYLEGRNIVIKYRYAEGKVDRLPNLAGS
jgi:putative ABC transport system substrate-binding protein